MKLGIILVIAYFGVNVALYGSPEIKVMGAVALVGLACLGATKSE